MSGLVRKKHPRLSSLLIRLGICSDMQLCCRSSIPSTIQKRRQKNSLWRRCTTTLLIKLWLQDVLVSLVSCPWHCTEFCVDKFMWSLDDFRIDRTYTFVQHETCRLYLYSFSSILFHSFFTWLAVSASLLNVKYWYFTGTYLLNNASNGANLIPSEWWDLLFMKEHAVDYNNKRVRNVTWAYPQHVRTSVEDVPAHSKGVELDGVKKHPTQNTKWFCDSVTPLIKQQVLSFRGVLHCQWAQTCKENVVCWWRGK